MNHSALRAKALSLAADMAAADHSPDIQLSQTRHRAALVASWHIAPCSTVLELGCGQGDMTAVLAEAVGPKGRVVAVDVAEPSYGAPVTLGESAARLAAGPLGPRIEFHFGTNVLDPSVDFPEGTFDHVVLAHCSWYFASLRQLRDTLARVRPWARHLWFTEWDLTPTSGDQLAHLLAVLVQGQIEAAGSHGEGNVRTPFSREELLRLLPEAGWTTDGSGSVNTEDLQDGDWEIAACLDLAGTEERLAALPEPVRQIVLSQADVLRAIAKPRGNRALAAYSVTAR
ncbi:methyltransferase domain-containing protein [Streptomyces sp. NBC_01221]|uniref:methyltransferase domain-containing protein n=2 Tax=unclassified Streptomyces TaxID=2593676 RepID=UPI0022594C60|nr:MULTISPECIES: methyltransferase domain-containing protein [unclassified Streptomyces]WSP55592.1 methyltransferase domain-containing protein [Streptomyces sp. NBC_01241]WSU23680.1 methyltransferase domain-containing protein [Streptomyces sp. NBC_01108]MCX4787290.1 methyltransferase domain-containing protein [Streptomyces sp. NBC_01221]MCX4796925.1 methyltransferase domain-containing protein [Streptomyces sp. NBC_01242]WSJ38244.1 methyltransferase domain-containing protein [Streptomyces sp. N